MTISSNSDSPAANATVVLPRQAAGAFLVSLNPALVYREYALEGAPVTVGRDAQQCEVACSGTTISRRHFRIHLKDGAYYLQDLNSTNGVFVNRRRIAAETKLADGDLIGIGSDSINHLRFQTQTGRNRSWTSELPPKQSWTIGRCPQSDVALAFESAVSWRHATVRAKGGRVEIVDGGSLNGTWINGRRSSRSLLQPTDAVTIGSTVLRFELLPDARLRVVRRDCGEEIALECVGLTREVGAHRRILDRVSLCIKPGEFVGLLGPSGAGKSTLLKAINGYNPPGYGCVLLNETPLYRSFDMFRNSIGYVPQDDIVHPELTVESSLDYVARLRLPPDVTAEQRRDLIDSTIETLGLGHVRKSRIIELSGGQRKRVSIGCELITRPSLLFLDEPTSGMDPSTEERLMRHFQSMARRGTTILITTHILYNLDMLDRVVIMARGRLVFFGTPKEAIPFFTIDGKPVERATQIFEVLEALHSPAGAGGDSKDAVAAEYERKYRESELYQRHVCGEMSEMGGGLLELAGGDGAAKNPTRPDNTATATQRQHLKSLLEKPAAGSRKGVSLDVVSPRSLATLTRRNLAIKLVSLKRALFYLTVPLVLALVTLSLRTADFPDDAAMAQKKTDIATQIHGGRVDLGDPIKKLLAPDGLDDPRPAEDVVFNLKHEGLANLPTPMSVLLMFVMTAVFMGTLMSCLDLSTERPIYIRERMANQKIADYVGSKLPFLLAITAVQILVFLLLCRMKPGLREFDLPSAFLAMVAMAWASCALGLFLSAVDPTAGQFSVVLAIVAVLPQLVFSGGLGPDFYEGMSTVMKGFANALPARWGLEMLVTAFYHHPDRTALEWIQQFVPDTIGFDFGPKVYLRNTALLAAQAFGWLLLCSLALKRLDKSR